MVARAETALTLTPAPSSWLRGASQLREVQAGHDGTWVAHPALVPIALEAFDKHMPSPNQISYIPACHVTANDLLETPRHGQIT